MEARQNNKNKAVKAVKAVKAPKAAPKPAIPSLVDLEGEGEGEGVASDAFMRAVETWPKTRANILEETRRLLSDRFTAIGSRNISRMSEWFTSLTALSSGAYGTIIRGCVRAWAADMTPIEPPSCVHYVLRDIDAVPHTIFLVIKLMTPFEAPRMLATPFSGLTRTFGDWVGERNGVREVMMGRLLNLLVVQGITPHFPLIYEPFHIVNTNLDAFAMELSHMSFSNFLCSKILKAVDKTAAVELLDVALLQITNGLLCAQKHYDFRHNDFHGNNAMMTFITVSRYTYKVADKYYSIPNYGMCWKLIDFGMAASTVFNEHDVVHTAMYSVALSVADQYFDLKDHAVELFDILRLVTYAKAEVGDDLPVAVQRAVKKRLDEYVGMLRDIAVASTRRGTLLQARGKFVENERRSEERLMGATPAFVASMQAGGLLEVFFHRLAAKFKTAGTPAATTVIFDSNASPFAAGDIVLEGITRGSPITVVKLPTDAADAPRFYTRQLSPV